jgi:glycosyltransferase involved in cell wall biosynthesis
MLQADLSLAFLCRSLDYGGAERQLILLAEGLAQQGVTVKIITFYRSPLSDALPLPQHPKLTIVCLDKKGRWQGMSFLWHLWRQAKGYPVVHSYLTFPNILTAFLKILSPRTKIIWGIRASNMAWHHYDWLARTLAWFEKVLSPLANGLIINSWAGLAFLQQQGYRNRHIAVIPNGIDIKRFYPHHDLSLRQEWGIADNEVLIGLVGRLDPMKDHATFLRAAAQLVLQRLPQARFVCVGNGSEVYQKQMQTLAAKLQLEPFLQWRPAFSEVERLYPSLDLLCQSSRYGEGMSNVLLEALACGTPCVATDVGDSKVIMGDYGPVVPPQDPAALAEAILTQLEKPSASREATAVAIAEKFSTEALVTRTLATLKEWQVFPFKEQFS